MTDTTHSRWLPLEGAYNVRDLGGYAAGSGQTRWRSLLRGDSLHRLTTADRDALLAYGVRTVIDLRHSDELEAAPNVLREVPGVTYRHVPIFRGAGSSDLVPPPSLDAVYRYIVDACRDGLREALTAIADAEPGGVLFHCTAGKDRTGIVAALVLGSVGVDAAAIADDYALTTEAMERMRPVILAQTEASGGQVGVVQHLLGSDPAVMYALLAYLNSEYGSIPAYIEALGLDAESIARLRARLFDGQTR